MRRGRRQCCSSAKFRSKLRHFVLVPCKSLSNICQRCVEARGKTYTHIRFYVCKCDNLKRDDYEVYAPETMECDLSFFYGFYLGGIQG